MAELNDPCCSSEAQATCCEPDAKAVCCDTEVAHGTCGCPAGASAPSAELREAPRP